MNSYLWITIVLILTGSGLPIPEEVPIIAAAVLSGAGTLDPFIALGCCMVGALVGDCIMYWIGYHFGRGVLRDRRWWSRWVTPEREERIEDMFQQHGLKVFFVARFLVLLRSPLYLTAGILRVSFKKFFLIDLICASVVVSAVFGLAYFFGQGIALWIRRGEWWFTIIVLIALAVVALCLWQRYKKNKALGPGGKRLEDFFLPPSKMISPPGEGGKEKQPPAQAERKEPHSDNGDGKKCHCCQPSPGQASSKDGEERRA